MVNPVCSTTDCVTPAAANLSESFQTVNNVSTVNTVQTVVDGNQTFAYLRESSIPKGINFVAPTIAVSTQCTPITTICKLRAFTNMDHFSPSSSGPDMRFNCSSMFQYDANFRLFPMGPSSLLWQMNFFQDFNLSVPIDLDPLLVPNPVYFGIAAIMDIHGTSTDYPLYNDSEIVHYDSYGTIFGEGFVLRCETKVYQAEYAWVNSTFRNFTNLTLSDLNTSLIVHGRFQILPESFRARLFPIVGLLQLINGGALGALQNTAHDLADVFATVYSQASLGGAAGVFIQVKNINEWNQQEVLLTRIPFAPFYVLVILNSIFATIGLLLGVVSAINIVGHHWLGAVQTKLSVWGLVDQAFHEENQIMDDDNVNRVTPDSVVIGVSDLDNDRDIRYRKFNP